MNQGGILSAKVERILVGSLNLRRSFEGKSPTFVAILIRRMKYSRDILPLKEIWGKKLRATGRNFLSQGEISCDRKKFPDDLSLHQTKYYVMGKIFLSLAEISCHRKTFPVTERIFISKAKISSHRQKFPYTRRYFLSQDEISCYRK